MTTNKELVILLDKAFGQGAKPSHFIDCSEQFRARYSEEFVVLENLNWADMAPSDLEPLYEVTTIISAEAFRWLIPHIFRFCLKWPEIAASISFINYFHLDPLVKDSNKLFRAYSPEEKKLVWEFLVRLDELLDSKFYTCNDDDVVFLRSQLLSI